MRVLRSLAFALVFGACAAACRQTPAPPPNVLLVVLDTTRADAISAYGGPGAKTPIFDGLASEGVLYTNARSTSAWTVPAHGSLFTGLYPSRHGAYDEPQTLPEDQTTLAELLTPTHQTAGFSENPHIVPEKGFAQGFEHFEGTWRMKNWGGPYPPTDDLALRWLEHRDKKKPFFLFLNFMAPHLPYTPPLDWQTRFVDGSVDERELQKMRAVTPHHGRLYMMGKLHFTDSNFALLRTLYLAETAYADSRVGRVLGALKAEGVLDRTLVIVVSDHGENIGDHGLMEHQFCLYETLLRVPVVMRLPGVLKPGRRSDAPVQLVDVPPTVLEIVGVPKQQWDFMEGRSLANSDPSPERTLFSEYVRPVDERKLFQGLQPDFDFSRFDRRLAAIQEKSWKLIVSDRGEAELYDLSRDPGETRNLAADRPQLVEKLRETLFLWQRSGRSVSKGPAPALDRETMEALRSLGYVE